MRLPIIRGNLRTFRHGPLIIGASLLDGESARICCLTPNSPNSRIVIGENSNFRGPEDHTRSRGVDLTSLNNPECIDLMARFIRENPALWGEDIGVATPGG